jgi:hypothetical protein
MLGVAVLDQRVLAGGAELPAERRELSGAEVLVAEHQHRMLGERLADPGGSRGVERSRQIDAEGLGAEIFAQRTE